MTYAGNEDPTQWTPVDEPLRPSGHQPTRPQAHQVPGQNFAPPYPASMPMPYLGPAGPSPFPGQPMPPVVIVPQPAQSTSGMAVASMVLGIVGILTVCLAFGVPAVLAIIFGHLGLSETSRKGKGGIGMAITGLVLGYVAVVPAVLLSIRFLVLGGMGDA